MKTALIVVTLVEVGLLVVVLALYLLAIIGLARRIVHQTAEITLALDGAMRNTNPLFDLAMVNHAIESITRGLQQLQGEQGQQDERSLLQRVADRILPGEK